MRDWLARTWRRARDRSPTRALRASGYEAAGATVGRLASAAYGRLDRGTPIWDRDWDVLCLLDGCRLDLMCEVAADDTHDCLPAEGDVDHLWSVGSQSAEWMANTFDPEFADEMRRTAYVTGNPFSAQTCEHITAVENDALPLDGTDFGHLVEPWRDEWTDGDISTIPPEPLTEAAIATWRDREALGVERVVVHYMQPHAPFRSRPEWFLGTADLEDWGSIDDGDEADETEPAGEPLDPAELDSETLELLDALDDATEVMQDPWTRCRDGELDFEAFWTAYRDNLDWVLDDVDRLRTNCDGRIVLSSDHGNAAGEFGVWSHPPGVHLPSLRRVPWVPIDGEDRGTVRPDVERGSTADRSVDSDVEGRLADLGYR